MWRYVYRTVDQYGQVIDVLVWPRRDADAARRFFRRALSALKVKPTEVVTDAAAAYPAVLDELIPRAWHHVEQYADNPIDADHGRLKHLRPMRGLRTDKAAQAVIAGHACMQNLRRGHCELAVDARPGRGSPPRPPSSSGRSDRGPDRVRRVRRSRNATAPADEPSVGDTPANTGSHPPTLTGGPRSLSICFGEGSG